jgi:hypothetical protein
MEDRLPAVRPHVDDDAVVLQSDRSRSGRHELEHPLRFVGRKFSHLTKGRHVPLGDGEEMGLRPRIDVVDRNEALAGVDVLALPV